MGFDGLSVEFYRIFKEELVPYLQELFHYCLARGEILHSWHEAKLVLIPNKEKYLRYPEAYHPISILNTDYKQLATILATQLNCCAGTYVEQDQSGVILGRYLRIISEE